MTPTKGPLEIGSSPAEADAPQAKSRPRPESAHLRADAVSLEIPIKVHGSLVSNVSAGASPQARPFEEQTTTMIVFPQGGVLKMSSTVSAGQVMVLTNLKSRQDAICRTIKVRAYGKTQNYVEVEFTSPQPGYWGVYFPSDGPEVARMAPPEQPAAPPAVPAQAAPVRPAPPAPAEPPLAGTVTRAPVAAPEPKAPKAPDVNWAPTASIAPPVARPPEPPILAESPQPAIVPPRPPALPNRPESSFAAIGTREDVLQVATSTKITRPNPFADSAKRPANADADISAAIDALIAPSTPVAPASSASSTLSSLSPVRAVSSERTREASASDASAAAEAQSNASVPHAAGAGADAVLPVPKQMFGVMLDSAKPVDESSRSAGSKMWIPFGIAALLAVGAAGAYYFHLGPFASAAAQANSVAAASAPVAQAPAVQPDAAQSLASSADVPPRISENQNAAVQSPDAGMPAVTARDLNAKSSARASEASAKPRELAPFAPRHAASPAVLASKPNVPAQPQTNEAIVSASGALKSHPVFSRKNNIDSAGAAPALDASGSPPMPGGSLAAIAPPASMPAPPKPVLSAPVRVGGKIQPPRLVSSVLPMYPQIAQQANVTGTVVIDTTIDKNGNVAKTKVISGPELLRGAALSALRQWKYEPSKLNGEPISIQMVVSIQFH